MPRTTTPARGTGWLDGICVIRTSLDEGAIGAEDAGSRMERAFRNAKSGIRPVHVCSEDHVQGHVFLCMLALYAEWHMRRALAPMLFADHDREAVREQRDPPAAPAEGSTAANAKAASKGTPDGFPAHSFRTLLADLGTAAMNWMVLSREAAHEIPVLAERTPLQRRAFELQGADPQKLFPRQAHPQLTEKPRAARAFFVLCP